MSVQVGLVGWLALIHEERHPMTLQVRVTKIRGNRMWLENWTTGKKLKGRMWFIDQTTIYRTADDAVLAAHNEMVSA